MGEFKHITVTAAEGEDEVVYAGIGEVGAADAGEQSVRGEFELSAAAPEEADAAPGLAATAPARTPARAAAPEEADAAPGLAARTPAPAPARTPARAAARKGAAADYAEQTLEDLQGAPMPTAQKVVIIAAVLCIIGAIVYYLVCMR